jgi:phosphoketolase
MVFGPFLRDIVKTNESQRNLRIFGPDETMSNLLGSLTALREGAAWRPSRPGARRTIVGRIGQGRLRGAAPLH